MGAALKRGSSSEFERLNLFIHDLYHHQRILKIKSCLGTSSFLRKPFDSNAWASNPLAAFGAM